MRDYSTRDVFAAVVTAQGRTVVAPSADGTPHGTGGEPRQPVVTPTGASTRAGAG